MPSLERQRIQALDVLRGFALCGILVANVRPIANAGAPPVAAALDGPAWSGILVDQRFFPLFSMLFGAGFALLLDAASRRTDRPRLVLLRRLLILLAFGLAHHFLLWEGDILAVYAVAGIVVLLPSTWLPRWAVAGLAVSLIAAALALGAGHFLVAPGLFLLGAALTRYGVVDRIEHTTVGTAVVGLACAAVAVPLAWQQIRTGDARVFTVAGLFTAFVYVCAVLLLLRTPLRGFLAAVFVPLGRTALTNYITASAIVLVITRFIDGTPATWSGTTVLAIAAAILAAQWTVATLWLRRFPQGPLEWLWRRATWAGVKLHRGRPARPSPLEGCEA